eukprot:3938029-Rhodomonas_salina.7
MDYPSIPWIIPAFSVSFSVLIAPLRSNTEYVQDSVFVVCHFGDTTRRWRFGKRAKRVSTTARPHRVILRFLFSVRCDCCRCLLCFWLFARDFAQWSGRTTESRPQARSRAEGRRGRNTGGGGDTEHLPRALAVFLSFSPALPPCRRSTVSRVEYGRPLAVGWWQ